MVQPEGERGEGKHLPRAHILLALAGVSVTMQRYEKLNCQCTLTLKFTVDNLAKGCVSRVIECLANAARIDDTHGIVRATLLVSSTACCMVRP